MQTNEEILREEIDSILQDIIQVYNDSGRKASGQFEEGLEAVYSFSPFSMTGTIRGFTYLAGRGKTKKKGKAGEPTVQEQILEWLKQRGIKPIEENMKLSSLAYLIARKIHKEGTNRSEWLRVYEQVITPERIQRIILKVSQLNVNRIVNEVTAQLEVLTKDV